MCQAVVNWVCWGSSRHYQEYRPRLPQGCTDSQIKNMGAIDDKRIKEEITLVTEGGEAAFKLRMEKYGF